MSRILPLIIAANWSDPEDQQFSVVPNLNNVEKYGELQIFAKDMM